MTTITHTRIPATDEQPRDLTSGQFGEKAQSAYEIATFTAASAARAQVERRHTALTDDGFVPASAKTSPRPTAAGDGAEYPQMAVGRHATYAGRDVTITLPSAASIKRWSYNHYGTFEFPVTAVYPDGRKFTGTMRVTQNSAAEWSCQGLDFDGGNPALAAEAVSAVLESRRPATALADAGDLLERYRARVLAAGNSVDPAPRDSFVTGAGYDKRAGIMAIQIGAKVYGYKATEARMKSFFAEARGKSIGEAYNRLKRSTTTAQVVECKKCHRFNTDARAHRCPSKHTAPIARPRVRRAPK